MGTPWTLEEVLQATGGSPAEPPAGALGPFPGIVTDTRGALRGALFVPLQGERHDGHDFVARALEAGAGAALWARAELPAGVPPGRLIRVAGGLAAYQALGRAHRRRLGTPVVAITGSVGKTTTKELVACLLSSRGPVHRSQANFNNEVGVPRTLLELEPHHEVAVVEMGMRGSGQIRELARLVDARVGLITAIGEAHLEQLGSLEAIADAKAELLEELPEGSTAVLPADSPFLPRLIGRCGARRIVSFGSSPQADWSVTGIPGGDLSGWRVEVSRQGRRWNLEHPLPGLHQAVNLAAALAVVAEFGLDPDQVAAALSGFQPGGWRSERWRRRDGTVVFHDAYNASPTSTLAALQVLAEARGRKVAVLGDMLELGSFEAEGHRAVGRAAAAAGVELLIAVGQASRGIAQAASEGGVPRIFRVASRQEALDRLMRELEPGDRVLLKASRGVGLELLAEALREQEVEP